MKELRYLGIKGTGYIDKRYGKEQTGSYSIFQCPVCLKEYELLTKKGKEQTTCKSCRGSQNIKHGMVGKPVYYVWQAMLQRCKNPKHPKFHIYGGKGITVDEKWKTFEGFWEDMEVGFEEGLSIDRKDSGLGYNKDNCRWITLSQNSSETTKRKPVVQLRKVLVPEKHFVEVQAWESSQKAAETLGLVPSHITAVCMGKRTTHGGFGWKYAE